jgi:hypothetical protein
MISQIHEFSLGFILAHESEWPLRQVFSTERKRSNRIYNVSNVDAASFTTERQTRALQSVSHDCVRFG